MIKKIAILGFGREGKSLLKFLKGRGLTQTIGGYNTVPSIAQTDANVRSRIDADRKLEIWVLDKEGGNIPKNVKKQIGRDYLKNLERFDLIFRSPGVPFNLPELIKTRTAGTNLSSATKLFFENYKGKVVGITGTKGKGTTATLLYKILKAAGRDVYLAGNIGKPALEVLPKLKKNSMAILELSSFQLQDLKVSPEIAVILDVFPDHLDAHKSLAEYYDAKSNIAEHQNRAGIVFFFKDNGASQKLAKRGRGKKIGVNCGKFNLFSPDDLELRGRHNFRNAVMAAEVAAHLGVSKAKIAAVTKKFKGLEHRLEFVRKIGRVSIYNDSVSTNPQTTIAAAKSFPKEKKFLIVGGRDRNLDYNYELLKATLKKMRDEVGLVTLFGENKKRVQRAIKGSGGRVKLAGSLEQAIKTAYAAAKNKEGVIIFSPGAKSFDKFKDYADRGEQFKKLVQLLK